jgi:predicted membrane protein
MGKRGQQVLAISLIVLGGLLLAARFLSISPGRIFWPLVLVILGVILVVSPQSLRPSANSRFAFAGDYYFDESWEVQSQEFRMFAGDVEFDLTNAAIPEGETFIQVYCFAGDLDVRLPADVGVKIATNAFVTDAKINGEKKEFVFSGLRYKSEGYDEAARKLVFEWSSFASDISLRHG